MALTVRSTTTSRNQDYARMVFALLFLLIPASLFSVSQSMIATLLEFVR
jgi:hypothetical protein